MPCVMCARGQVESPYLTLPKTRRKKISDGLRELQRFEAELIIQDKPYWRIF